MFKEQNKSKDSHKLEVGLGFVGASYVGFKLAENNKFSRLSKERFFATASSEGHFHMDSKVDPEFFDLFGNLENDSFMTQIPESYLSEYKKAKSRGLVSNVKTERKLQAAADWKTVTGMGPIFTLKDGGMKSDVDYTKIIRHEDIHTLHAANLNHSFVIKAEKEAPDLLTSIKNSVDEYEIPEKIHQAYLEQKNPDIDPKGSKFNIDTERMAWHYENDLSFISRAEQAGVKTRTSEARRLKAIMKSSETNNPVGWASKLISGAKRMSKSL